MKKAILVFFLMCMAVGLNAQTTYNLNWDMGAVATPADLTIEVGDTVEWTFTDAAPHSVTSDAGSTEIFDSGILSTGVGTTYSHTFTLVGSNPYHCNVHLGMTGTITVQAAPPACPDPSNLTCSVNTTQTTTEVTWTENGMATQWEVKYGSPGFDPMTGGTSVSANSTTLTLTGLSAATQYEVYIQAICGGDVSNWIGPCSFTTATSCSNPSNLAVGNITTNSADISWTENGSATEWEIKYGPMGFDPATAGTSVVDNDSTPAETLSGLTPTTHYDVYVRAICGAAMSNWVGPEMFVTDTPSAVEESYFEGFSFYPNPVKGKLTIKANYRVQQVVMYDILGKRILTLQPDKNMSVLKTAGLKPGVYLMEVSIEGSTGTYRVIKE